VNAAPRPWWVYVLACRGERLYCGVSPDVEARLRAHAAGRGAKFTRAHPPERLLAARALPDRGAAQAEEARLKRLPRARKLAWVAEWAWTGDAVVAPAERAD
jgi:putative endonuclease